MNRRELLAALSAVVPATSGCAGNGGGTASTASPSATPTDSVCDRAFSDRRRTAEDCAGTEFTFAGVTSTPAETVTEGTPSKFHDYVVLRLEPPTEQAVVRGCIDAVERGRVPFERTLDAGGNEQELRIGPFIHHGVGQFAAWVVDCRAEVQWPGGE